MREVVTYVMVSRCKLPPLKSSAQIFKDDEIVDLN